MSYLFLACVSIFLVSFVVADHSDDHKPKFCGDVTKCNSVAPMKVNFTCVSATSGSSCAKDVADGKADLTLANANNMIDNEDKLKIVYSQKLKDIDEKYVKYYGLAVVKKNTTFNFKQLKTENSCHTGAGKSAGWIIPVGYLLSTKEMNLTKDQYKSTADFFGKSCAPGIGKVSGVSQAVIDDLCSLCGGTGDVKCTKNDPYAGHDGAFKCMAAGNNDRVGFFKQNTAEAVINSGSYGNQSDYKLLCTDGGTKTLDKYKDCNIGKKPANALVTSKGKSNEMVTKYQNMLEAANLTDLINGGMVDSSIESLEKYPNTFEKYVDPYAKYYKAVQQMKNTTGDTTGNTTDDPTTGDTTGASSVLVSFALQVVAIFAFALLV